MAASSSPLVQAGTPIALSTIGEVPKPPVGTPTVLEAVKSSTPLPANCGATDQAGTPLASTSAPAAAATPEPSANGPIVGQPAPGPYAETGKITIESALAVAIGAYDVSFKPNTLFVKPGQHVELDIKNGAGITHDFCSPALGISTPIRVDRPRVPEDTLTAVVTFMAPSQPGVYMFWSNVQGQAQQGMTGEVVVQP